MDLKYICFRSMRCGPWRAGGSRTSPGLTGALPDDGRGHGSPFDPRRDCAIAPSRRVEHHGVSESEAVTSLVLLRAPMRLGDSGPAISVLVSLAAQSEDLLFDAVAVLATRVTPGTRSPPARMLERERRPPLSVMRTKEELGSYDDAWITAERPRSARSGQNGRYHPSMAPIGGW